MSRRNTTKDSVFHAKWCALDCFGWGDRAALMFLRSRGFKLTNKWTWRTPRLNYQIDNAEAEAIEYLRHQWKLGGLDDGRGQVIPEAAREA